MTILYYGREALKSLMTLHLLVSKLQLIILVAISRAGVVQGFEIVCLTFFCTRMNIEYFNARNVILRFSFLFENNENMPLIDGE